ncbi:MAG: UDP-N-acetyl glucosamine 2-epimerase [Acidimicrobiia bacterium]|nr:UDP-N-acetyl glucosamine 2-epimerase [Acidimicrobiia bacterium]
MVVAGARPNFMKIASIMKAIEAHNRSQAVPFIQHVLVHTGQHYDEQMSNAFFRDLEIPKPDVDLEVGSGSHAQQTAEIMKRFEGVLLKETPSLLLVVGDVNSTAACSLVASKIAYPSPSERPRPLIAHIEAGLRSFDRSMPEEINRLVTDTTTEPRPARPAAPTLRAQNLEETRLWPDPATPWLACTQRTPNADRSARPSGPWLRSAPADRAASSPGQSRHSVLGRDCRWSSKSPTAPAPPRTDPVLRTGGPWRRWN